MRADSGQAARTAAVTAPGGRAAEPAGSAWVNRSSHGEAGAGRALATAAEITAEGSPMGPDGG